jgi:hypothetical protein
VPEMDGQLKILKIFNHHDSLEVPKFLGRDDFFSFNLYKNSWAA